jgi:predicted DNA-binding transcriptional regulator YafY
MPKKNASTPVRPPGKPKNDENPSAISLLRMFHIHQRLCDGRKVVAQQLEIELNTSRSTIMRTVRAMREALGAPVEFDQSAKTYHYTHACDSLPIVKFEQKEALMLVMAAHAFASCAGNEAADVLLTGVKKILPLIGSVATYPARELAKAFASPPKARTQELQFFDRLVTAILERRVLQVCYQSGSATKPAWRELHPLRLAPRRDKWVLLAFDPRHAAVRPYVLLRIHDLKFTGAQFTPPADFDPEALLRPSIGRFVGGQERDVHLVADAAARTYLEETPLHLETQQITPRADGRLDVRLRTSSREELRNEILKWSNLLEVLSPADLRDEVLAVLRRAVKRYEERGERESE